MREKIVKTSLESMIHEHKKLIKVLKTGTLNQIKREIVEQSKELKNIIVFFSLSVYLDFCSKAFALLFLKVVVFLHNRRWN